MPDIAPVSCHYHHIVEYWSLLSLSPCRSAGVHSPQSGCVRECHEDESDDCAADVGERECHVTAATHPD